MPTLKTYDLFISHSWDYNAEYNRLTRMLRDASYFKWRNYSVPREDPADAGSDAALTRALKRQVRPVNCVLILAGMYAAHRKWIQKEIDIAKELGKPIVGIRPWGSQRTPIAVSSAAKEMVGWNTQSIVRAIRAYSL
ncbi:MAG: TIR domain-containing protein [bacterium]|nr:TIR domain-containing protein [bacterium]